MINAKMQNRKPGLIEIAAFEDVDPVDERDADADDDDDDLAASSELVAQLDPIEDSGDRDLSHVLCTGSNTGVSVW